MTKLVELLNMSPNWQRGVIVSQSFLVKEIRA